MIFRCPIRKSPAQELPRTGDATGYRCVMHSNFEVADTVFAEQRIAEYTRERREIALRKAMQRAEPGKWPVIRRGDF